MAHTIGNPLSWAAQAIGRSSRHITEGTSELGRSDTAPIDIRDLTTEDLILALRKGFDDFVAFRTDVMAIVVIYPIIGLILTWFTVHRDILPVLFPMIAGFALLGPVLATGLYEMSRLREQGRPAGWSDAFGPFRSPSFIPIAVAGGYLAAIYIVWMIVAVTLFNITLGPDSPASAGNFITEIFTTGAGWTLFFVGNAVGAAFAALVLALSLVTFPLLLDRHVGILDAMKTSFRVSMRNPAMVAIWGGIVVVALGIGVATFFLGLIFVLPILGHATWHLYRLAVVSVDETGAS